MVAQMYQVSTLQALTKGDFYSNCTIDRLLQKGNLGLGTFKDVDGEMIILDGICYRAKADGTVSVANADDSTPFASVTFFKPDLSLDVNEVLNFSHLQQQLYALIKPEGENYLYACRIDGHFTKVLARSEINQPEPYIPFAQVLATGQREFEFQNVGGSLVGVYFPKYMNGLNMSGWHIHFISDDRTMGGHVFDCVLNDGIFKIGKLKSFELMIPDTEYFHSLKLEEVTTMDIEEVEKVK